MKEATTHLDGRTTYTRLHSQKLGLLISSHSVKTHTEYKACEAFKQSPGDLCLENKHPRHLSCLLFMAAMYQISRDLGGLHKPVNCTALRTMGVTGQASHC